MDKFELDTEQWRLAAEEFSPVAQAVDSSQSTAASDSGAFSSADWGNDEMGQAFASTYLSLRPDVLDHGKANAEALDSYRSTFVDVHDEFVGADASNKDQFDGIGEGIAGRGPASGGHSAEGRG